MKTVVITGSARGLGFEMAKLFKQNNLNVVISDLNLEALEKTKREIKKYPYLEKEYKVYKMLKNYQKQKIMIKI